jgi:alkanesulfonate monooxygenase SsuD/methylene tetrahydromethanopterin reductase-like flavin-dependent oxidoreductase (luciferase family)
LTPADGHTYATTVRTDVSLSDAPSPGLASADHLEQARPIVRFGAQLWPQGTDWPTLRDAGIAMDEAGWDLLLTWDHLLAIEGPWEQPSFEGWSLLAAWAVLTERVELGLLVGANTFRNPGLTAKLAVTLDHLSGGRAILGLGAAWNEREHDAHGLDFGPRPGVRLDRLDEALTIIRRALAGERFDFDGTHYQTHDLVHAPRPNRDPLPILVGGSGPRKTLRIVARHADIWDTAGSLAVVAERDAILREHCAAIGRDQAEIGRMVHLPIVVRDTSRAAEEAIRAGMRANGVDEVYPGLYGPPALVADGLRPFMELGFRDIVSLMPAPYDRETIDRIGEVRELLDG